MKTLTPFRIGRRQRVDIVPFLEAPSWKLRLLERVELCGVLLATAVFRLCRRFSSSAPLLTLTCSYGYALGGGAMSGELHLVR